MCCLAGVELIEFKLDWQGEPTRADGLPKLFEEEPAKLWERLEESVPPEQLRDPDDPFAEPGE